MQDTLESIRSLCQIINDTEFSSPGMFTNAMISRPELTTLIRDALQLEQQLYKITRAPEISNFSAQSDVAIRLQRVANEPDPFTDLQPQRIDGRTSYLKNQSRDQTKATVVAPQVVVTAQKISDTMSLPTKRRIASQFNLIPRHAVESNDPIEMCNAILALDEDSALIGDVSLLKSKASKLKSELELLYKELQEHGPEEDEPEKDLSEQIYDLPTQSINELIAKENAEVSRLEKILDFV